MDIKTIAVVNTACLLLLFTAGCAETTHRPTGKPATVHPLPQIKKDCTICHQPAGAHSVGNLKKPLSDLCLECHRDRRSPNEHKVDIPARTEVKGLPLFDGKITCLTCHDPHANTYGSMLRMTAGDLCMVCHPL
jgi:predicted CXXCH cytochrome family protein